MNTEPATRDFSAFAHDREVKCLVKGNNVIAAERCIDEQKLGCWCEAGYGALRALESLSAAPPGSGEQNEEARRIHSRRGIDLVQLKARAAGFAKSGQDFAGAALSHMNRELQRKVTMRNDRRNREAKVPATLQAIEKLGAKCAEQTNDQCAGVAQTRLGSAHTESAATTVEVEQRVRNPQVAGSNPAPGVPRTCSWKDCTRTLAWYNKSGVCATHSSNAAHERQRLASRPVAATAPVLPVQPASPEVAKEEVSPLTERLAAWQRQGRELRLQVEAERAAVFRRIHEIDSILESLPKE